MNILGIDIGGTGIKGAMVNTDTGEMITDRLRLETPEGARPKDVAGVVLDIVHHFAYQGPVGVGFPSLIRGGIVKIAANIDRSWIGLNASELFEQKTGCPTYVVNDADAAGMAELRFGAAKEYPKGVVLFLTIGTGIGSALFVDGVLLPNTELGHLELNGKDAEKRVSDAARKHKKLTWKEWAGDLQEYLDFVSLLFSPDVIIIGGGASKNTDKYLQYLKLEAKIIPATLQNQAGIIGAAMFARDKSGSVFPVLP